MDFLYQGGMRKEWGKSQMNFGLFRKNESKPFVMAEGYKSKEEDLQEMAKYFLPNTERNEAIEF